MLIEQQHSTLPIFDTTAIHAEAAVKWALER
jgi:aspartate/glutamate racemase